MEKPILFNTKMVRSILEGRKTQTRRVIKPQPKQILVDNRGRLYSDDNPKKKRNTVYFMKCPYGKPGDTLWVRETWCYWFGIGKSETGVIEEFRYKADNEFLPNQKWKPSIHMPKSACRLRLLIKDIRVERIQDITIEDIVAEGVEPDYSFKDTGIIEVDLNHRFAELWDNINFKRGYGYASDPWVWVVEFEIME